MHKEASKLSGEIIPKYWSERTKPMVVPEGIAEEGEI